MTYEIYAFGNGEVLVKILDGLAMCLNSHSGSLFQALKQLGLILGVFWAALYMIYSDQMKVFSHWIIPMTLMMNLLFVPSTAVWVHDPVNHYHQKVSHVPYGLAVFASYVSKIGYHLTGQVEKVFTLPDDLKYQKSGCVFGSQIVRQAKHFRIINQDVNDNMQSFVQQCVIYPALLGHKYTLEDLRHSSDLWGLISSHASGVRCFLWQGIKDKNGVREKPQIITCKQGVVKFNKLWTEEIAHTANLFGKKLFGNDGLIDAKTQLLQYLPLAYGYLGKLSQSASDLLQQQMMIYAMVESVEQHSSHLGNGVNFAARKAYLQQQVSYQTLGEIAGSTLPAIKGVLEALAYACFLFVIPLALLPFGWRFLSYWGQILLWLQMWAPLYAVLNYIMTMVASGKTATVLSLSNSPRGDHCQFLRT